PGGLRSASARASRDSPPDRGRRPPPPCRMSASASTKGRRRRRRSMSADSSPHPAECHHPRVVPISAERHPFRTELTPVAFLRRSAYVFPDKTAVVHGRRRYTYRQFEARAHPLAPAP